MKYVDDDMGIGMIASLIVGTIVINLALIYLAVKFIKWAWGS